MADYIKREDLLDLYDLGDLEVENAKVPLNVVIQTIKDMPSADVRKHGKWIDPADLICYKCTACGMYANQGYGIDEPIFLDYCPNCGAKMDDKDDG